MIKGLSCLICFLSLASNLQAIADEVGGNVMNYGVVKFSGEIRGVNDPSTPTGKRWSVRDATFTSKTNRIWAAIAS